MDDIERLNDLVSLLDNNSLSCLVEVAAVLLADQYGLLLAYE